VSRVDSIVIDTTLFDDAIEIDGYSSSLNPYDSRNSAFVGNFSSAYISRGRTGAIESAERQTPLTPLAVAAGQRLPKGKTERINLGKSARLGAIYGGELLAAFLRKAGVKGAMRVDLGVVPSSARRILAFRSSQDLASIVRGMLKYSTNFTANQLFLVLGSAAYGGPATVSKAQRAIQSCLEERVGWREFHVEEGAGLSRRNRVSSSLMTRLLAKFERYRDLLPEEDGFIAKTGTLRGVNTLIGYFDLPGHGMARFSVLVNSEVPHLYKFQVARTLRSQLMGR
jgi:D-alanyl-D-alanine carboxypeptidase/D-alanyl-D-alanine-endopeptidase (penicillin-binding protein 4)